MEGEKEEKQNFMHMLILIVMETPVLWRHRVRPYYKDLGGAGPRTLQNSRGYFTISFPLQR